MKLNFPKWWTKFFINPWFGVTVVSTFLTFLSWITQASYFAEKTNTIGLWTVISIVLSAATVAAGIKTAKTSNTGTS